jgi:hypothetical protein
MQLMIDVTRYRIDLYGSGTWTPHTDPNGRWVRYEDYRAAYERGRRDERERIVKWVDGELSKLLEDEPRLKVGPAEVAAMIRAIPEEK